MLLVKDLWKWILLVCLSTSLLPSSRSQNHHFFCFNNHDSSSPNGGQDLCDIRRGHICGIDTITGKLLGCVDNGRCPGGTYSLNLIVCGSDSDICCCDSPRGDGLPGPNQPGSCNDLFKEDIRREACTRPKLQNTDWCRPNVICAKGPTEGDPETVTCDKKPAIEPYCRMHVRDGYGSGCVSTGNAYSDCGQKDIPGSEVICKDEDRCCCRGNDKEPCNVLTKQVCQLELFKEEESCKRKFPSQTPPPPPEPVRQPTPPSGCDEGHPCSGTSLLGTLWLVMGMTVMHMMK